MNIEVENSLVEVNGDNVEIFMNGYVIEEQEEFFFDYEDIISVEEFEEGYDIKENLINLKPSKKDNLGKSEKIYENKYNEMVDYISVNLKGFNQLLVRDFERSLLNGI